MFDGIFRLSISFKEKIQVAISLLKNNINYESPTECLNIYWVGGYESAQMLNAKRALCLEMESESCIFTDSVDADHVLTLIEAKEVCIFNNNLLSLIEIKELITQGKTIEFLINYHYEKTGSYLETNREIF